MSEIDTGGFVHPNELNQRLDGTPTEFDGITRRDWLAGQALKGMLSNPNIFTERHFVYLDDKKSLVANDISNRALIFADALIAESRKGEQ